MEDWEPGCGPKPTSPPPRRRYIINDTTIEAKIRIHSENPRGLLDYTDELAGRFTRMNKYRGGHGDDMQQDLTEFNGGEINKDRTKESIFLPRSAISCTGSIQWETLRQLQEQCGADDHAGVWARWLFCVVPMPPPYLNLTGADADLETRLGEILEALYHYLGDLPEQDYFLSTAAKAKFERWQHKLVNKLQEETIPVLKSAYPKMEAYAARLALLIHIIWAVAEGQKPDQFIPEEMMGRALYLTNFYLSQLRLLVSHNGQDPETKLEGYFLKIRSLLERKGSLTARNIKSSIWSLRKASSDQLRTLMEGLAQTGVAQIGGSGRNLTLYLNVDVVDVLLMQHQHSIALSQRDIQPTVDVVDENSFAEKNESPENRILSTPQIASTTSTNGSAKPETLAVQRIESTTPTSTTPSTNHQQHQQFSNQVNIDTQSPVNGSSTDPHLNGEWIPQVGERVKFQEGKCPVSWSELELTVVEVVDPEQGIFGVRAKHWQVNQHVTADRIQPYPGGGP